MEITKHQKSSALIGPRASFGLACLDAKKIFPDLTIFTADTYTSAGLLRFKKKFPEDIVEVSIAEQLLVSSAAGYSLSGGKVIATTFAPFITMRAYEMIRHNLGYMKAPVLLVGLAAGIAFGQLGYTHCCIEDVSIISSIPKVNIYSPIDAGLISQTLEHILKKDEPSYLRITGEPGLKPVPIDKKINEESLTYKISNGSQIIVLTTGSVTSFVYQAYNLLEGDSKKKVGIYGINKILPLNLDFLKDNFEEAKNIIIVEEGIENGFYGQFLINYPEFAYKSTSICHPKEYLECGTYKYMLQQAKLDEISILNIFKKLLE
jgi:transketolase